MKVLISITADNAAFEDEGTGNQLASILETVAQKVYGLSSDELQTLSPFKLFDLNGNSVGRFEIED